MNFDDLAVSDAQHALVRLLRGVLAADHECASLLLAGLEAADRESLPTEPDELLDFARAHLTEPLTKAIGPNLTLALFNDLSAEIVPRRSSEANGTGNVSVDTPPVAVPVRNSPSEPAANVIGRLAFPKLRRSVANLVRTATTRLRAAVASAKIAPQSDRLPVLLVHPDRLIRASIARALVNARFDVTGFDTNPELIPAVRSRHGAFIAIVDVGEKGVEAILRSLATANPDVRVLAWTQIEVTVAESVLRASGVKRYGVVPRAAAEIEIVDAARRLGSSPS